jgi:hypothetical protein
MTSDFGRIAIREFSIFSPSSWIPTAFYNCGPGYTNGTRNPAATDDESVNARVYTFEKPDGSKSTSVLDLLCRNHDLEYEHAAGKPNESELLFKADSTLVSGIIKNFSTFEPTEKAYGTLAIVAFSAKMAFYDAPSTVFQNVTQQIAVWGKQFAASARNQTLAELTQTDGTIYSCLKDSEGNFVFSCAREDETQSVTLDHMLRVTGAIQQFKDNFGEIYEETQININPANGISEVTHIADGEVDAEGVIVGKPTLDKLDRFLDLANASYSPQNSDHIINLPGTDYGLHDEHHTQASSVLDNLNIRLTDTVADDLDNWFAEAEAIRLQAYRWDTADKSLKNLWLYGGDNTLAAYDLQSVMEANMEVSSGSPWNAVYPLPEFDTPSSLPPIPSEYLTDYEYSLSDVDLGLDNSTFVYSDVIDYGFDGDQGWWNGGGFSSYDWSSSYIDPLVLKLGGGSVHTTNLQGSTVMFDMAANGQKVRTGWITPDHAFLVRDRNRNGVIDDSSEMFSERTSPTAATGFAALAQLDTMRNGKIDYRDKAFRELRLWTDINVDGLTQKGELHTLEEFGITYLSVKDLSARNVYDNGNLITHVNYFGISNRRGNSSGQMAEVLFNFGESASATSIYLSDQATTVRTADGRTIQLLSDKAAQTVNASMSGINLLIGGKGDVLNAGNSRQTLLVGSGGTTMNGNAGVTHFVVNGTGNKVNTGTGESFIEVHGDANTINAEKGQVRMEVEGSRNQITIGSEDFVDLGGTGNTLKAAGGAKDNRVVITGQKEVVNLGNSDIALQENSSATVNGRNNDITQQGHSTLSGTATGGRLMVWGEDNIATINNALVGLAAGAELQLTGRNDKVVMEGDNELLIKGSAAGTTVSVFGQSNQVQMTGGSLMMAEGAALDLSGRSNTITMLGDNDLTAHDRGQRVEVYGQDNQAWVNGSAITEHGSAEIDLYGTGNSLKETRLSQWKMESLGYDRHLIAMEILWEQLREGLESCADQSWRGLPDSTTSTPLGLAGLAPVEAMWNADGVRSLDPIPSISTTIANPLNARPLIAAPSAPAMFS